MIPPLDVSDLFQPRPEAIPVIDPEVKLYGRVWVPFEYIHPTAGMERYNAQHPYPPSLCILYQLGKCHLGSRCNQVHPEKEYVAMVRQLLKSFRSSNCCLGHGDLPSCRRDFQLFCKKLDLEVILTNGKAVKLPSRSVAVTAFWEKAIQTFLASGEAGPIQIGLGQICNLHQKANCKYGVDCKHVHLCREVFPHLAPIGTPSTPPIPPSTSVPPLPPSPPCSVPPIISNSIAGCPLLTTAPINGVSRANARPLSQTTPPQSRSPTPPLLREPFLMDAQLPTPPGGPFPRFPSFNDLSSLASTPIAPPPITPPTTPPKQLFSLPPSPPPFSLTSPTPLSAFTPKGKTGVRAHRSTVSPAQILHGAGKSTLPSPPPSPSPNITVSPFKLPVAVPPIPLPQFGNHLPSNGSNHQLNGEQPHLPTMPFFKTTPPPTPRSETYGQDLCTPMRCLNNEITNENNRGINMNVSPPLSSRSETTNGTPSDLSDNDEDEADNTQCGVTAMAMADSLLADAFDQQCSPNNLPNGQTGQPPRNGNQRHCEVWCPPVDLFTKKPSHRDAKPSHRETSSSTSNATPPRNVMCDHPFTMGLTPSPPPTPPAFPCDLLVGDDARAANGNNDLGLCNGHKVLDAQSSSLNPAHLKEQDWEQKSRSMRGKYKSAQSLAGLLPSVLTVGPQQGCPGFSAGRGKPIRS